MRVVLFYKFGADERIIKATDVYEEDVVRVNLMGSGKCLRSE